jgi:hypothetical protein
MRWNESVQKTINAMSRVTKEVNRGGSKETREEEMKTLFIMIHAMLMARRARCDDDP